MAILCNKTLKFDELEKFRQSIKKNYMIEYSIDDSITFAEPIGYYIDDSYFLKTHLNLTIYYKEDFSTGLNYIDFVSINLPKDESEVLIDKHYENLSDQTVDEKSVTYYYSFNFEKSTDEIEKEKEEQIDEFGSAEIH